MTGLKTFSPLEKEKFFFPLGNRMGFFKAHQYGFSDSPLFPLFLFYREIDSPFSLHMNKFLPNTPFFPSFAIGKSPLFFPSQGAFSQ